MNQHQSHFQTVKSHTEKFVAKVGLPKNTMVNLFFNFNLFAYMEFVGKVENLAYLIGQGMVDYEDGTSGMAVELTEDNSLSRLVEDLPVLLNEYVEKAEPTNVIRKGKNEKK